MSALPAMPAMPDVWNGAIWTFFTSWFPVINFVLAIPIIFLERRNIGVTWAWLMVLLFLPVLGFFLYLVFGQNLARRQLYKMKRRSERVVRAVAHEQVYRIDQGSMEYRNTAAEAYQPLIHLNLKSGHSILTQNNEVTVLTEGREKFDALLGQLQEAKEHIHLLYYKISYDKIGSDLLTILVDKARSGVKVRLLYDAIGSPGLPRKWAKELTRSGAEVYPFFPSLVPYLNLKINYRNHRKVAVIDGKTGFIGGFNIGNEYLGLDPRIGHWRDTHLMLRGGAVYELQRYFLMDWSLASGQTVPDKEQTAFFPPLVRHPGGAAVQIVTSGPNTDRQQIKTALIKLIHEARDTIWLQTPYFVPDESVMTALKIAALSGVDVRLMVPFKGDHRLVQWATQAHVGELLQVGARCFQYERGFLHAKTLVVDGRAASVGTANMDHRSFVLNFEINAFLYDEETAVKLQEAFQKDLAHCREFTLESYRGRSFLSRVMESMSRLLSPIL
ncbi:MULTISPECIES: cardiolipin synthase [Paenibacillus]|uniref:cardiolipin synthase n=1 Tax=Paenibacillus TaxID=44249 RepID=UPI0022B8E6EB|nr:cardiolipin synthase [Paenibacillus caseinilyticus]MCZ8522874.1 cardiolipin synthase [Paenibacillus caseinilyticus]